MKLLQELLTISDNNNFLFEMALLEELGNLNLIDKHLLQAFKKKVYFNTNKSELGDTIGRNSKVETFIDKDQNKAFDHLNDKDNVAIVLKFNDEQVLAVVSKNKLTSADTRYDEKNSYTMIASPKFFDIVPTADYENNFSKTKRVGDKTYQEVEWDFKASKILSGTDTSIIGKIKKVMKALYTVAKGTEGATLTTMVITRDSDRTAKTISRSKAREGSIPLPTGNRIAIGPNKYSSYEALAQRHFKSLGYELRSKLDSFKASKAKSFDNSNDLLTALINEGYFEKVKFMGFTYKFYQDRVSFRDLTDKAKGKDDNYSSTYIEYQIDESSAEYKNLEDELLKYRSLRSKEEVDQTTEEYYAKRKELVPPRGFKVILKLDGGKIVPEKILIGKEQAWMY
jgi:hypothetical protein